MTTRSSTSNAGSNSTRSAHSACWAFQRPTCRCNSIRATTRLRRGSDEWVTGPTEIAGDQTVLRLDVDQRRQTKRGPPGDEHIIDWITLDTQVEIFPDAKQNFGSNVGLATYDFHWFVGDRVTVVSTAADDFFSGGERMFTIGAFLNRPPRGSFYVGFYSLEGPFRQESITTSYVYRMTPKWAVTFSDSFNVVPNADLSLSVGITRISESFLMTLGVNSDASRGTVGASFMLEPRRIRQDQPQPPRSRHPARRHVRLGMHAPALRES